LFYIYDYIIIIILHRQITAAQRPGEVLLVRDAAVFKQMEDDRGLVDVIYIIWVRKAKSWWGDGERMTGSVKILGLWRGSPTNVPRLAASSRSEALSRWRKGRGQLTSEI
jgi:hypothetical protein